MATLLQLCQPFDHAVMAVIQQLSGAMMDKIMLVFTFLGEETFAILLLIAVYRTLGVVLTVFIAIFILYAFTSPYLPGILFIVQRVQRAVQHFAVVQRALLPLAAIGKD